MGDYLENGLKLGVRGKSYYSTRDALLSYKDCEIKESYLRSSDTLFSFPYPEFDGKGIGEYSILNLREELVTLRIKALGKSLNHHKVYPRLKSDYNFKQVIYSLECPYVSDDVTSSFDYEEYVLLYESNSNTVVCSCVYCDILYHFSRENILESCINLYTDYKRDMTHPHFPFNNLRLLNIITRILKIYDCKNEFLERIDNDVYMVEYYKTIIE